LLPGPDRYDLAPQLVAQDARIGEKGLLAPKGVEIRAAHADPADADQRLAGSGRRRRFQVDVTQLSRRF
jgi:hypothetical protein